MTDLRAVWKFPLDPTGTTEIVMPQGGRILRAGLQDRIPHIWVEVIDDAEAVTRRFRIVRTGERIPDELGPHVASFVMDALGSVAHLYEVWPDTEG